MKHVPFFLQFGSLVLDSIANTLHHVVTSCDVEGYDDVKQANGNNEFSDLDREVIYLNI